MDMPAAMHQGLAAPLLLLLLLAKELQQAQQDMHEE
jgi:hypothetical protein